MEKRRRIKMEEDKPKFFVTPDQFKKLKAEVEPKTWFAVLHEDQIRELVSFLNEQIDSNSKLAQNLTLVSAKSELEVALDIIDEKV